MKPDVIIAIASGKGGTGKTTLATAMAGVLGASGQLLDCDVEEPNAHLFLNPRISESRRVTVPVPRIDESKCTYCRKCQEVCRFNALVVLPGHVLVFDQLCHGCGGCVRRCPERCITEGEREIGFVEKGLAGDLEWVQGRLRIGEAMAPPLIREVKKEMSPGKTVLIDAPPGTSCPVIASVQGSDFVILVTEPTPFGRHDLKLAIDAVRVLGIPCGVVLNRADMGDRGTHELCSAEGIPVLLEIPHDRKTAENYASGGLITDVHPEYKDSFVSLADDIRRRIFQERRRRTA